MFNNKKNQVLLTAFSASVFYGIWALIANASADNVIISASVQFITSFIFGSIMAIIIEWVFEHTKPPLRFVISAFAPYSLVLCLFVIIHNLIHTENIIATLLPNAIIGTLYFVMYCLKLEKQATKTII